MNNSMRELNAIEMNAIGGGGWINDGIGETPALPIFGGNPYGGLGSDGSPYGGWGNDGSPFGGVGHDGSPKLPLPNPGKG